MLPPVIIADFTLVFGDAFYLACNSATNFRTKPVSDLVSAAKNSTSYAAALNSDKPRM